VRAVEDSGLLPNAVFVRDPVPRDIRPFAQRPTAREQWLSEIRTRFEDRNVVFLDPDNGLAAQGLRTTCRRAGKSVFIEDIMALTQNQRAMVVYHHQTHRKGGHRIEIRDLAEELRKSGFRVSGVLRARPWSPRAFFILDGGTVLCSRAECIEKTWDGRISWHPDPR
jgi:hypothetical protein